MTAFELVPTGPQPEESLDDVVRGLSAAEDSIEKEKGTIKASRRAASTLAAAWKRILSEKGGDIHAFGPDIAKAVHIGQIAARFDPELRARAAQMGHQPSEEVTLPEIREALRSAADLARSLRPPTIVPEESAAAPEARPAAAPRKTKTVWSESPNRPRDHDESGFSRVNTDTAAKKPPQFKPETAKRSSPRRSQRNAPPEAAKSAYDADTLHAWQRWVKSAEPYARFKNDLAQEGTGEEGITSLLDKIKNALPQAEWQGVKDSIDQGFREIEVGKQGKKVEWHKAKLRVIADSLPPDPEFLKTVFGIDDGKVKEWAQGQRKVKTSEDVQKRASERAQEEKSKNFIPTRESGIEFVSAEPTAHYTEVAPGHLDRKTPGYRITIRRDGQEERNGSIACNHPAAYRRAIWHTPRIPPCRG